MVPLLFFVRRHHLWPVQRERTGRWSGGEVFLAFMLMAFMPGVAIDLLDQLGLYQVLFVKPPSRLREDLWAAPLATLLTLAFLFWLLFSSSKMRPADLGLTRARWRQNTLVGYGWFLVVTPLVLAFYFLILLLLRDVFDTVPQEHPLTEVSKEPLFPIEWILLFLRATVAAVILEEVVFRGVLQGWLRRASLVGHGTVMAVTLAFGFMAFIHPLLRPVAEVPAADVIKEEAAVAAATVGLALAPAGFGPIVVAGVVIAEETPTSLDALLASLNLGPLVFAVLLATFYAWTVWRRHQHPALVAIFGSAMLFAVFHSMVWPSPVPLLLLGLALGFLAYRTQSLIAGMVLHGLFNTVACLSLVIG